MRSNACIRNVMTLSFMLLAGVACTDVTNPDLQGKKRVQPTLPEIPEKPQMISDLASGFNFEFNPKVDILFVIDNSNSMEGDQYRLAKNISSFVDAIEKNPFIDYHIGVVPVYDKRSYEYTQVDEGKYDLLPEADQFYDVPGYLQPLLDPVSFPRLTDIQKMKFPYQKVVLEGDHPPYVTRDLPNHKEVLQASLFIGVIPLDIDGVRVGPEDEELFRPVVEVLNPSIPLVKERNSGFRREDAHFVVIFITDTDDANGDQSSQVSVEELNYLLDKHTNRSRSEVPVGEEQKNYSVYGVIFPPTEPGQSDQDVCPGKDEFNRPFARKPYELQPQKITELLRKTRKGTQQESNPTPWLALCDPNFGEKLAAIGEEIRIKATDVQIRLQAWPERLDKNGKLALKVYYGDQEIAPGPGGWQYDIKTNSIFINSNFNTICGNTELSECNISKLSQVTNTEILSDESDHLFRVEYTPVDLTRIKEGHARKIEL